MTDTNDNDAAPGAVPPLYTLCKCLRCGNYARFEGVVNDWTCPHCGTHYPMTQREQSQPGAVPGDDAIDANLFASIRANFDEFTMTPDKVLYEVLKSELANRTGFLLHALSAANERAVAAEAEAERLIVECARLQVANARLRSKDTRSAVERDDEPTFSQQDGA